MTDRETLRRNLDGDGRTVRSERTTLRHREDVAIAARTVRMVVRERRDRVERGAEFAREDDAILAHVHRLLAMREDLDLSYLAGRLQGSGRFRDPFRGYAEETEGRAAAYGPIRTAVERSDPADLNELTRFTEDLVAATTDGVDRARTDLQQAKESYASRLDTADQNEFDALSLVRSDAPVALLPVRLETRFVDDDLLVRIYPEQLHVDAHESELTETERRWGREFWARLWFAAHRVDDSPTAAWEVYGGVPPDGQGGDSGYTAREWTLLFEGRIVDDDGTQFTVVRDGTVHRIDKQVGGPRLPDAHLRAVVATLYDQYDAFSTDRGQRFAEIRERAWETGVERFGRERAAYIVHALSPTYREEAVGHRLLTGFADGDPPYPTGEVPPLRFPAGEVGTRPASWSRQPRAELLPDRFEVYVSWVDPTTTLPPSPGETARTRNWTYQSDDGSLLATIPAEDGGTKYVKKVTGRAVREPLPVGPTPEETAQSGSGDATPDEMAWMTDWSDAAAAGMGVRVSLSASVAPGLDEADEIRRVTALGVRTTTTADETAAELGDLLSAHRYTDGLSLLEQGTPTNNTGEADAGSGPAGGSGEGDGPSSPPPALSPPTLGAGTDGDRLARALGLGSDGDGGHVFGTVENAGTTRSRDAGHVNETLWPGTLGYFLQNLFVEEGASTTLGAGQNLAGGVPDGGPPALSLLGAYRDHFADHVRPAGPLHTLRTDDQPYGVLPVTPLSVTASDEVLQPSESERMATRDYRGASNAWSDWARLPQVSEDAFVTDLVERLLALRPLWERAVEEVPRVEADGTVDDQALLDALGTDAVGDLRRRFWAVADDTPLLGAAVDRDALGRHDAQVQAMLDGTDLDRYDRHLRGHDPRLSRFPEVGAESHDPDLTVADDDADRFLLALYGMLTGRVRFRRRHNRHWPLRLRALGTAGSSLSLSTGDVDLSRTRLFETLTDPEAVHPSTSPPGWVPTRFDPEDFQTWDSLVREVLRFSSLRELLSARVRVGAIYGDPATLAPDPSAYASNPSPFDELRGSPGSAATARLSGHPDLLSDPTHEEVLTTAAGADVPATPDLDPYLREFTDSLLAVAEMDPDRVGTLFRETLGPTSHRLDAWLTSLATRRLFEARDRDPDALLVGAAGVVEHLSTSEAPEAEYLLAPSLNHATTGAILRSVHAGAEGASQETLEVDLSPERVATARRYLSGVRGGLSLSQLLGYRFERGLRAVSAADDNPVTDAEKYIHPFREYAPSVENRLEREPGTGTGTAGGDEPNPARRADVVDGHRLYRRYRDDAIDWGMTLDSGSLPGPNSAARTAIETDVLDEMATAMDAVSDVLKAEAVHQLAMGNPERASAAMDALSRGEPVPDLDVLTTPTDATGVTHRLLLLFGEAKETPDLSRWDPTHRTLLAPADLPSAGPNADAQAVTTASVRGDAEPQLSTAADDLLPAPDRVACGAEFSWTADRSFARGTLRTPTEPGRVAVDDVGFEPDVVLLSFAPGVAEAGSEAATDSVGWTRGSFRRAVGDRDAVQQSIGVATDADGTATDHRFATDAVLDAPLRTGSGQTDTGRIRAVVADTTAEGFELDFTDVGRSGSAAAPDEDRPGDLPERSVVAYTAIATGDATSVRVGHFRTAPGTSGTQPVRLDDGAPGSTTGGAPGFDPDHVLFATASPSVSVPSPAGAPPGISWGEAVLDGSIDQRAVGVGYDPANDRRQVAASDDAVVDLHHRDGTGTRRHSRVSIAGTSRASDGTPRLDLSYDAPGGTAARPTPVTFVAVESAEEPTPTGEEPRPPALDRVATPDSAGETVAVSLGFRPGLVEVVGVLGVDAADEAADGSLSVATESSGALGVGTGAATSGASQGSLAAGLAASAGDTARAGGDRAAVLSVPSVAADGSVADRLRVTVDAVDDDGLTLRFPAVPDGSRPLVFLRAYPKEPTERAFDATTSVTMSALRLTPLDVVEMTQTNERAGDSQLERRIGYHAFRHRPDHEPPVPDGATLTLSFTDPPDPPQRGPDEYTSVAALLEAARSVRDLVSEARPADAEDLAHPAEAAGPGYLPGASDEPPGAETARQLAEQANPAAEAMSEVEAILDDRVTLLDPDSGDPVTDAVAAVQSALTDVRLSTPVESVRDTVTRVDDDVSGGVEATLFAELADVRAALRAGPADGTEVTAAHVVEPIDPAQGEHNVVGTADVTEPTDVVVLVRSHADGEWFPSRRTTTRTDADGTFRVGVDFDGVQPGTAFTVTVFPDADGDGTGRGGIGSGTNLPPLAVAVERLLDRLDAEERAELFEWLVSEELVAEHIVARVDRTGGPPVPATFGDMRPRTQIRLLERLGREDLADAYEDRLEEDGSDDELPPLAVTVERITERLDADERAELFEWLVSEELVAERIVERVERTGELRPRTFGDMRARTQIRLLEGLGRDDLADAYEDRLRASTTEILYAGDGRVVGTPPGPDLASVLAEATVVPRLLWLSRVADAVRPTVDSATSALQSAVDDPDMDWGAVADEHGLMKKVLGLVGSTTGGLSQADVDAVGTLRDLDGLDLSALADAINVVTEPVDRTGLSALVDLTGDLDRPGDQRFWVRESADLDTLGEKDAAGEVRARLERFKRAPEWPGGPTDERVVEKGWPQAPPAFAGYAPQYAQFAANTEGGEAFTVAVESIVADPSATVEALDGVVPEPDVLVARLHELLHHADRLRAHTTSGGLVNRLDDLEAGLRSALGTDTSFPFEAELFLDAYQAVRAPLSGMTNGLHRRSVRPSTATLRSDYASAYDGQVDDLVTQSTKQIDTRLVPAFSAPPLDVALRRGVLAVLRRGLLRASYFGVYGSTPASPAGGTPEDEAELMSQARTVSETLKDRANAADKLKESLSVDDQLDRLAVLLGDSFPVLPPFAPTNPTEVHDSFAQSDRLLDGDDYAVDTWLQRLARTRDRPGMLRETLTYGDTFRLADPDRADGSLRRSLSVAQLPHDPNPSPDDLWLGLDDQTPEGGEVSLAAAVWRRPGAGSAPLAPNPGSGGPPVAGLFVDEWVESVPEESRTAGVGLRYDDPNARALQSILLAVPPRWHLAADDSAEEASAQPVGPVPWSSELLRRTAVEAVDQARLRTVDMSALQETANAAERDRLGIEDLPEAAATVLPATYMAYNASTAVPQGFVPDAPTVRFDRFWEGLL